MRAHKAAWFLAVAVLLFAPLADAQPAYNGYVPQEANWLQQGIANNRYLVDSIWQGHNEVMCDLAMRPGATYRQYLSHCRGIDVGPNYVGRGYGRYGLRSSSLYPRYPRYTRERVIYRSPRPAPRYYEEPLEESDFDDRGEPIQDPEGILYLNLTDCELRLDGQEIAINGVLRSPNANPAVSVKSKNCDRRTWTDLEDGVVAIGCAS